MGVVYVADQLSIGRQRALKVIPPEVIAEPSRRERFVLEARAASQIDSDHVVEIVAAGVDEATSAPYIVMELLKGEDLSMVMARLGALPLGDVDDILQQIGHAMERAHALGIVHRDLKPENIFVVAPRRRDGSATVKILDFGVAKILSEGPDSGTQPVGTPLFMAPEQSELGSRICPATDVWALGLITFRLLTGHYFWRNIDNPIALLRQSCFEPIPAASQRAQELGAAERLPAGFEAWFARCVNSSIADRFPEAGAAVRAFSELVPANAPRGALLGGDVRLMSDEEPASTLPPTMPQALGPGVLAGEAHRAQSPGARSSTAAHAATVTAPRVETNEPSTSDPTPRAPPSRRGRLAFAMGGLAACLSLLAALRRGPEGKEALKPPPAAAATSSAEAQAPPSIPPASAAPAAAPACPEDMVLIQGGKMFMGARDLGPEAKPPHQVTVSTFCLDRTEVTARAYHACSEKGECERALDHIHWPGVTDKEAERYSPLCNTNRLDQEDHPINCVAWSMADSYCQKHRRRLPTEAEWEFAARGSRQRKYPWGDEPPSAKHLNACGKKCGRVFSDMVPRPQMYDEEDGYPGTAPVGAFPAGTSAHGVIDLVGNVSEWIADWFGPYPSTPEVDPRGPETGTERAVRGGNFFAAEAVEARPAFRWKANPDTYSHLIGFRCAQSPR